MPYLGSIFSREVIEAAGKVIGRDIRVVKALERGRPTCFNR